MSSVNLKDIIFLTDSLVVALDDVNNLLIFLEHTASDSPDVYVLTYHQVEQQTLRIAYYENYLYVLVVNAFKKNKFNLLEYKLSSSDFVELINFANYEISDEEKLTYYQSIDKAFVLNQNFSFESEV